MDLDANALLASLFIGSVGFVSLAYGKKQGRVPQMVVGLILMIYPYFVSNVILMIGIAVALCALLWLAVHLGW